MLDVQGLIDEGIDIYSKMTEKELMKEYGMVFDEKVSKSDFDRELFEEELSVEYASAKLDSEYDSDMMEELGK